MEAERKIIQVDQVSPRSPRKKRNRTIILLSLVILLAVGLYAGFQFLGKTRNVIIRDYTTAMVGLGQLVSTTEASGTVVYPVQVDIMSPQEGYADELLVSEGDYITPADVLAILDVPELEDQRNLLIVELEQARLELENLEIEYRYSFAELERSLVRLEKDITEAEEDVQAMKELAELKSSRQSDYEDAMDTLESLQEDYEDTVSSLAQKREIREIAMKKQEAAIRQLEVELEDVQEDIEEARIKSPIAGEVLSINEDLAIPGTLIGETDDTLFVVADRDKAFIDFDVYEQYTGQLSIGGMMTVTIGTNTMDAEIVKIGKIATLDTEGLTATVEVRAHPITDLTLTPGASAVASIILGIRDDVLLLPRGSYLTTGGQKYVYLVRDNRAYKTSISFGDVAGTQVEILKGLKAGDEIITSGYQDFIDENTIDLK